MYLYVYTYLRLFDKIKIFMNIHVTWSFFIGFVVTMWDNIGIKGGGRIGRGFCLGEIN